SRAEVIHDLVRLRRPTSRAWSHEGLGGWYLSPVAIGDRGTDHFLLKIFHRLLDKWRAAAPGVDDSLLHGRGVSAEQLATNKRPTR
ncbi:MAG: hypothetical protein ACRDTF_11540, partial [Pseudonocardiaceae bacterium]